MKGGDELRELPVARDLLKACRHYLRATGEGRVDKIVLGVGELQDLDAEELRRCFQTLAAGTAAQGARLVVNRYPIICRCRTCREDYVLCPDAVVSAVCPICNGVSHNLISGAQLRIEGIYTTKAGCKLLGTAASP